MIVEGKETFTPSKCFSGKNSGLKKTVPKTVLDKIRIKRKAFKTDQNYRTKENYNAYVRTRNQVKWTMKKSVKWKETVLAKNIKNDPKSFFAYVSSKTKHKENIANSSLADGTMTVTDRDKSEASSSFFSSVFTVEDTENIPPFVPRTGSTLSNVEVTVSSTQDRLSKLNVSKSEGPDGIHPRLLKELSEGLAFPLKILFDKTPKEGKLPKSWKRVEVKPIFKTNNNNNNNNNKIITLVTIDQ